MQTSRRSTQKVFTIVVRHSHFCCALHVTMEVGLYLHPLSRRLASSLYGFVYLIGRKKLL